MSKFKNKLIDRLRNYDNELWCNNYTLTQNSDAILSHEHITPSEEQSIALHERNKELRKAIAALKLLINMEG